MLLTFSLQTDYTLYGADYQLFLPLDVGYKIPLDDPVRLLNQFIERMFLGDLYRTYYREESGNHLSPRQMLKIVVYAYMNGIYSSRKIEEACRRDINFMWLMNGGTVPDHCKISRFRSSHLAPCAERIMAEITEFLYELGEITGETIFIDGTKIEACANKYTFVWKKAVTKRMQKLLDKLAAFVGECEELYGLKLTYKKQVKMKHVKNCGKSFMPSKNAHVR